MNDLEKLAEMIRHNIQGERWFILLAAQLSELEDEQTEAFIEMLADHKQKLKLLNNGLIFFM